MKTNTVANLMRILAIVPKDAEALAAKLRLKEAAVDAAKVSIFTHMCEAMNDMPGIVRTVKPIQTNFDPNWQNRYGIED